MRGATLTAREGYVYTDGTYFGTSVYLGKDDDGSGWHEIPREELEQAEEADYVTALQEFGVMV